MKFNLIYMMILIGLAFPARSQDNNLAAFKAGNDFYASERYNDALQEYSTLLSNGQVSSELYYNLGNCYFRLDSIGKAIWCYQKAIILNPKNQLAIDNLTFLESQTEDDISLYAPGFRTWVKQQLFSVGINFWIYCSIAVSILIMLLLAFYRRIRKDGLKSIMFYTTLFSFVLLIFTSITAYYHFQRWSGESRNYAILNSDQELKGLPAEKSQPEIALHEGCKFEVIDEKEGWSNLQVGNYSGWIKSEHLLFY